jgi:inosine/xanthosine triphosphate pyrophosphatase family protein
MEYTYNQFPGHYTIKVSDSQTGRTFEEQIKAESLEELNEKLKKAYSNCMVAIVSGLKNDKR